MTMNQHRDACLPHNKNCSAPKAVQGHGAEQLAVPLLSRLKNKGGTNGHRKAK